MYQQFPCVKNTQMTPQQKMWVAKQYTCKDMDTAQIISTHIDTFRQNIDVYAFALTHDSLSP